MYVCGWCGFVYSLGRETVPSKVTETKQRQIDAFVRTSTYRVRCLRMRREAASELITKGRCREGVLRECAKSVSLSRWEGGRKLDWMWAMERERQLGDHLGYTATGLKS